MKRFALFLFVLAFGTLQFGCCPAAPAYPDKDMPWAQVNTKAQQISDNLNAYINDWFAGKVSAQLPPSLIPDGCDPCTNTSLTLYTPSTVTMDKLWGYVEADYKNVNLNSVQGSHWDPHCTYLLANMIYLPFGHTVIYKGKFPKCRYFCVQMSPPLDNVAYYKGFFGSGEIPIVDADIEPDSGSVNPFRIGQARNATNRNYTIQFKASLGNTASLNPQCVPPTWRAGGNMRYASGITFGGPWSDPNSQTYVRTTGKWTPGVIWVRNYLPDTNAGFLAGAGYPTMYYQTPAGQQYVIGSDMQGIRRQMLTRRIARTTSSSNASSDMLNYGWTKQFGILPAMLANAASYCSGGMNDIRTLVLGVTGMGENQPAPGCWENAATCGVHINYLLKMNCFSLGTNTVATVTGTLPTFPKTMGGQNFVAGQMRYLSITGYDGADFTDTNCLMGYAINSICDEEMVLNANNEYVLCYSRASEKPTNATAAAGVTWVNWGLTSKLTYTLRWCSVGPDHTFNLAPHEVNLTWKKTAMIGTQYDPNILGKNTHTGWLGKYQPVWKSLSKADFESLGSPVTIAKVEAKANSFGCGSSLVKSPNGGMMVMIPLILIVLANVIYLTRRKKF